MHFTFSWRFLPWPIGYLDLCFKNISKHISLFVLIFLLLISNLISLWLEDVLSFLPPSSLLPPFFFFFGRFLLYGLTHSQFLQMMFHVCLKTMCISLVIESNILHMYVRLTCELHYINFIALIFVQHFTYVC